MIRDILTANEKTKPNSKEIQALKENFPACFDKEGNFDFNRFKEYLSDKTFVKNEGYELRFLGKNYSRLIASLDTETVIEPDTEHNAKPENANSENIYISGDNLDALKQLLKSYANSVKCIYIDPPYNTGSDGFVYNDKFNFTAEQLSERLSISEEEAAKILDLTRRGSASHSAWLMFMYPRLLLARDLLSPDGVIFISIDDNEQANLKLLCDDVFGEENCLANLVWRKKYTGGKGTTSFADYHEYILAYARDNEKIGEISMARPNNEKNKFIYEDDFVDERGKYYTRPLKSNLDPRPTLVYPIDLPDGTAITTQWICSKDTYLSLLADGRIEFKDPKSSKWPVYKKFYEFDDDGEVKIPSFIEVSNNNEAKQELKELFNIYQTRDLPFQTPKPTKLIQLFVDNFTSDGDIVMDFFSGSASTSHAVVKSCAEQSKKLKYIAIQIPEDLDTTCAKLTGSDKTKAQKAIDFLNSVKRPHTLDQIGIERIIRAAKKIREEYPDTTADLGFKHYTLREVAQDTIDKMEEFTPDNANIFSKNDLLETFGEETVLATYLVRDGYGFNAKYETLDLAGYRAYYIQNHVYLLSGNFTDNALEELAKRFDTDPSFNPQNVVLFAYSFDWRSLDLLKVNLKRLKDTEKNLRLNFDMRY